MNNPNYILISLIFLLSNFINAQPDSSKISVIVNELHSNDPVQGANVYFYLQNDTLKKGVTDSLGKFEFMHLILSEKEYFLSIQDENSYESNDVAKIINKDNVPTNYTIEISLRRGGCELGRKQLIVFYEENETKNTDFDFDNLANLMSEYPQMCLNALPFYGASENELISDERLMYFKKRLVEEGIEIDRIEFKPAKRIKNQLDNYQVDEEYFKPHIDFEVIRIDGNCN